MRKLLIVQLLLCPFSLPSLAQDRVVTGKVTSSEDGSVLPGVNVTVRVKMISIPACGGISSKVF
ncbi:MAG: hypothetical protein LH609_21665 [Rudanella sp.]|nr:hypothetical protein [Rudanella sp.]